MESDLGPKREKSQRRRARQRLLQKVLYHARRESNPNHAGDWGNLLSTALVGLDSHSSLGFCFEEVLPLRAENEIAESLRGWDDIGIYSSNSPSGHHSTYHFVCSFFASGYDHYACLFRYAFSAERVEEQVLVSSPSNDE